MIKTINQVYYYDLLYKDFKRTYKLHFVCQVCSKLKKLLEDVVYDIQYNLNMVDLLSNKTE